MVGARIDVDDRLTPGLQKLKAAGGDLTRPFAEISEKVLEHTQDRYAHELGPDGVPWLKSKAAIAEGRRTLYERGDLYNALERISGADFAAVGVLETGGPAVYAGVHQGGFSGEVAVAGHSRTTRNYFTTRKGERSKRKRARTGEVKAHSRTVNIVARPFLGIEERDLTEVERIVLEHLARAADGEGASQ